MQHIFIVAEATTSTAYHGQIEAEIAKGCSLLYLETPINPTTRIIDIARLAKAAHAYGAVVVVVHSHQIPRRSCRCPQRRGLWFQASDRSNPSLPRDPCGVTRPDVRILATGIENVEDLIDDLVSALKDCQFPGGALGSKFPKAVLRRRYPGNRSALCFAIDRGESQ